MLVFFSPNKEPTPIIFQEAVGRASGGTDGRIARVWETIARLPGGLSEQIAIEGRSSW